MQGLVISRILYRLVVYAACNNTQIQGLQKLLSVAAHVISGRMKLQSISDVLTELDWFTAEHIFLHHSLSLLEHIVSTSEPEGIACGLVMRGDSSPCHAQR